jgi:hypothetical protein
MQEDDSGDLRKKKPEEPYRILLASCFPELTKRLYWKENDKATDSFSFSELTHIMKLKIESAGRACILQEAEQTAEWALYCVSP